uniref:Uncharacterized protein n=1 Tax=Chenopodium quinoa TaxID=63459 RepID=A0A803MG60_CHEQI
MYTQMLCGLYERNEVLCIRAIFASGLLRAIRFLQVHFSNLCHDINTSTSSSTITHLGLRACMDKIMRPDPELSEFINHVCEGENWEGIIRRIWPNTKYLDVIVTGAMAQYIPMLDYYSGGLHKVSYTIMPNMTYFECIPLDDNSTHRIVDFANVEVGKEYEIVVTTQSGLYRYKVGDVLYMTGFQNSTPQVKFVSRKNVLLNMDIDNTDEFELQNAIESASTLLKTFNARVVEYTSYANVKSIPGHYVMYLELLTNDTATEPDHEVLGQCSLAIEEALNSVY